MSFFLPQERIKEKQGRDVQTGVAAALNALDFAPAEIKTNPVGICATSTTLNVKINDMWKQAGAELCQAQDS